MSTNKIVEDYPTVIVRAFGDEPVALLAYGAGGAKGRVLVGTRRCKRPISLPEADVFPYDKETLHGLRAAYQSGDRARLQRLYEDTRNRKKALR